MARSYANVSHFESYDDKTGEWKKIPYGKKTKGAAYKKLADSGVICRVVYKQKKGYQGCSTYITANADKRPATMTKGSQAVFLG